MGSLGFLQNDAGQPPGISLPTHPHLGEGLGCRPTGSTTEASGQRGGDREEGRRDGVLPRPRTCLQPAVREGQTRASPQARTAGLSAGPARTEVDPASAPVSVHLRVIRCRAHAWHARGIPTHVSETRKYLSIKPVSRVRPPQLRGTLWKSLRLGSLETAPERRHAGSRCCQ